MSVSIISRLRVVAVAFILASPGVATADTASCLSDCTKAFVECRKTTALADCLQRRKDCIETCGSASD